MAESEETKSSPPYGSFGTFWNYVNGLKAETLPPQLDRSMMRGKSGSDQAVINMGLKFFELVGSDKHNTVLPSLKELVAADSPKRNAMLAELVRTHYPKQIEVSEQLGTENLLHESFESAFNLTGETRRKAATFFLHAAAMADIKVSPNFPKARSGQGRSAGAAKKAVPRKRTAGSPGETHVKHTDTPGDPYAVSLIGGGTVTLIVHESHFNLSKNRTDREFVYRLVDAMTAYADTTNQEVVTASEGEGDQEDDS